MFRRWARWIYRHRVSVLWLSAAALALSVVMLVRGGRLTTGVIHGIEASDSAERVDRALRSAEGSGFVVLFERPGGLDDEAFAARVRASVAPLRGDPRVESVRTPFDDGVSMFLASSMQSVDGSRALAQVTLRPDAMRDTRQYAEVRARVRDEGLHATATGLAAFKGTLDQVLQEDLVRAEVTSMPVTALVLVLVFGSLLAAVLPVGTGALAVLGGVACVMALSRSLEVAQYAVNIVSLVGLGVAIDYSLFMVNRFREELAQHESVEDALARTVETAGRAVVFSGVAVAIGLAGLLLFWGSYIASLGLAGTVVVALSVVFALTFLPALLGVLGRRVASRPTDVAKAGRVWRRVAQAVMRRPVTVFAPTLLALLALGHPFLGLQVAIPDIGVLPPRTEASRGHALLREHFPERVATRLAVVAEFPGAPLGTASRVGAVYDLSRSLAALPGVDHVESAVDVDPMLDRDGYVTMYTGPAELVGETAQLAVHESVASRLMVLSVVTDAPPASAAARALVARIRTHRRVADGTLSVTGPTAMDVDTAAYIRARVPWVVAVVIAVTLLVLFVLLRSVVLPLKAVAMNLLSITGSFGALVWVFQQGHLASLLRFTPGPIDPSLPVVLFCATFGLSMDYEVLLLTRMQEEYERSGDNTYAVAEGLARSGRLITSAAAIMVVVFSSFITADVILLKSVGLGMAVAVALDATVVRMLLVPATMRLLGDLNWWAPKFLARASRRITGAGH